MLSRAKPAIGPGSTTPAKEDKKKKKLPKVEDFLNLRDYTGAITLLEVRHFITLKESHRRYYSTGGKRFRYIFWR
jgi:hypothetical protein